MKKLLPILFILAMACNQPATTDQSKPVAFAAAPVPAAGQKLVTVLPSKDTTYILISATATTTTAITTSVTTGSVPPVVTPPPVDTTKPPTTGRPGMTKENTFEGQNTQIDKYTWAYASGWRFDQGCCTYSVTQAADPIRSGNKVIRFESRSTDPDVSGHTRAEVTGGGGSSSMDTWTGFELNPVTWTSTVDAIAHQWHTASDQGSPPVALTINGGSWRTECDLFTTDKYHTLQAMVPNKWTKFVFHIFWSSDPTKGLLEIWIDGKLVWSVRGKTNDGSGYYEKAGVYGWLSWQGTRVLLMDNYRTGKSYNDVAP